MQYRCSSVRHTFLPLSQCSQLLPVRLPEADNFGGGPGNFFKIFLNFMFVTWDSRQEDWQLFWLSFEHCLSPPGWRGIVVTVRAGGWAGGCQTCGTHISVTTWWIFSVRSSMELSRPVVVHCHAHTPICPIWACPWAKNLSNLPQIGSRLCGSHISETAGWIYPI